MNSRKKIVFLTGTRADFGKMRPLINIVKESDEFDYFIFVTGMHTLSKYGNTYVEVQKFLGNEYENYFVFMNQNESTDSDVILTNTITGFGNFVKEINPDMIVIHGDRIEALAGSIVGSFNNILVSHIEGGEISGTLDELTRHATTKLSHVHFVSNVDAKNRLLQMGENESNIFVIGSPDIEVMKSKNLPTYNEVKNYYEIPFDEYSIFIFHPVVSELSLLHEQIKQTIDALIESNRNYIVIYPNNDSGSDKIINEFARLANNEHFKIYSSVRFEYFLSMLKNSKLILGNSSVGIRESEIYQIPSIDIGSRQKNRTNHPDIIHVNPQKNEILEAINNAENKTVRCINSFGDGENTSKQFFDILCDEKIWATATQKQFVDI